jgi:hypothetical protein
VLKPRNSYYSIDFTMRLSKTSPIEQLVFFVDGDNEMRQETFCFLAVFPFVSIRRRSNERGGDDVSFLINTNNKPLLLQMNF